MIATLMSGPAVALRKTKQAINAATLTELEAALERETQGQLALLESERFPGRHQGVPAAPTREVHRRLTHLPRERPCLHADTPRSCVQNGSLARRTRRKSLDSTAVRRRPSKV